MGTKQTTTGQILRRALTRLKTRRPSTSLRGLARSLEISPAHLSNVMNDKSGVSPTLAEKVIEAFSLDEVLALEFKESLIERAVPEKLKVVRSVGPSKKVEYKDASTFNWLLEKWYYIAIMDLLTCKGSWDVKAVADKLGLKDDIAKTALKQLAAHNLVVENEGFYRKVNLHVRLIPNASLEERRNYYSQIISLAQKNLEKTQDFDRRLIAGISVALNSKDVEKLRERVAALMHEIAAEASGGECDQVYMLSTLFFPVTKR